MSKYITDDYILTLFDERGTKIERRNLGNVGLTRSIKEGTEILQRKEAHSFSVARNLFNSFDTGPW